MELEKVAAEIRPRTTWEAIDLGVRLVSEHALLLVKGWMASVYPLAILILALCYNSAGWGMFLIWWLKPVWERVVLHPLSRGLFGEHPTWRETMMVLPRELRKNKMLVIMGVALTAIGWWIDSESDKPTAGDVMVGLSVVYWLVVIGLCFFRSGMTRSLVLPIRYLEGLDGQRYRARYQTLSYRSWGSAMWLTVICFLMENLLYLSQILFVVYMIPEGVDMDGIWNWEAFGEDEAMALPNWIWMVLGILYLNSVSVVAWFYTGAGFGLYVNTRTWSEGWDIELKFKGLGQRLGVLAVGFLLLAGSSPLEANQDAQRVLDSEEFEVRTRGVYEDDEQEQEAQDSSSSSSESNRSEGAFEGVGDGVFWGVAGLAVAGLIWLVVANAHLFRKGGLADPKKEGKKVTTVAGMNVEPENLPDRLLDVARALWDEGRHKESLGLLYRGAISALVTRQLVEIEESDTELDCLLRVTAKGPVAHSPYFKILTEAWISEAYAQRRPDAEAVKVLWTDWPFEERRHS